MARDDPQVNFRIPSDLLRRLRDVSEKHNRTLTSEIVDRLEHSFPPTPSEGIKNPELREMMDFHLKALRLEHAAGAARASLGKLELPKDPEAIADKVAGIIRQQDAYSATIRKAIKMFEEADALLANKLAAQTDSATSPQKKPARKPKKA